MADTIVVLFAAFGGGLAGAVLQPVVSHVLSATQARDAITRRRERRLRAMLESQVLAGRNSLATTSHIMELQARGEDYATLIRKVRKEFFDDLAKGEALWQPHRIVDTTLRELAERYNKAAAAFVPLAFNDPISPEEYRRVEREHDALQAKLEARMDELHWPEVDP